MRMKLFVVLVGLIGSILIGQGRYFVLTLPSGAYAVQASPIGHKAVQKTDIKVRLDLTTSVDFKLPVEVIEEEVMTVVVEGLMVEKSLTSSRSTIGAAELNNTMPVSDLQELVNTPPSVFRGYIRGGRKSEAKVLVDGIDVSDTYFHAGEGAQTHNGYVDVKPNEDTGEVDKTTYYDDPHLRIGTSRSLSTTPIPQRSSTASISTTTGFRISARTTMSRTIPTATTPANSAPIPTTRSNQALSSSMYPSIWEGLPLVVLNATFSSLSERFHEIADGPDYPYSKGVGMGMVATAVGHDSWGRIKASFA